MTPRSDDWARRARSPLFWIGGLAAAAALAGVLYVMLTLFLIMLGTLGIATECDPACSAP